MLADRRPPSRRRRWVRGRRRAARDRRRRRRPERRRGCAPKLEVGGLHVARSCRRSRATTRSPSRAARRTSGTPTRRRAARTTASPPIFGDLRGRARARAGRPQPRARRHLHPLRRRRAGRDRRAAPAFYEDHQTGTIMAPLDRARGQVRARRMGRRRRDASNGFLAKCTKFDEDAVSAFFRALPVPRARAIRPGRPPARSLAGRTLVLAGVAERVRRARLKSGCPSGGRAGSSPAPGIRFVPQVQDPLSVDPRTANIPEAAAARAAAGRCVNWFRALRRAAAYR